MSRAESYFDFMVCALRADGTVTQEEKAHLLRSLFEGLEMRSELVQRYTEALSAEAWADPEEVVRRIAQDLDPVGLIGVVRDAYIMASADHEITDAEVSIIRSLLKTAGIPEDRFAEIDAWGREAVAHVRRGAVLFEPELVEAGG